MALLPKKGLAYLEVIPSHTEPLGLRAAAPAQFSLHTKLPGAVP